MTEIVDLGQRALDSLRAEMEAAGLSLILDTDGPGVRYVIRDQDEEPLAYLDEPDWSAG